MKKELHIFLTAVMFYTRIPCPRWVDHNPQYINLCTRYFPLIGWIVGGIYAASILISAYLLPPAICVLLGMGISVLLTGAFHEDGFADVCDGFGGGWTKEKILVIMKDSRVGTYGLVGIALLFGVKFSSTFELMLTNNLIFFVLLTISSHAVSRMMAVIIIYFQPYAREDDQSKAKPLAAGIRFTDFIIALVFGLMPFIIFVIQTNLLFGLAILPLVLITLYLAQYFNKWIGGYTGDCLGATQQVNEVMFLLSVLAIWKFI